MTDTLSLLADGRDPSSIYNELYAKESDPWGHLKKDSSRQLDRSIMVSAMRDLRFNDHPAQKKKLLLELGCGLGQNQSALEKIGFDVLGADVSEVAIRRGLEMHSDASLHVLDVTSQSFYPFLIHHKPNILYFCHITWYIINKIDEVLETVRRYAKEVSNPVYIAHIVAIYPPGQQLVGTDKFTDSRSILSYFSLDSVVFHGECWTSPDTGSAMLIGKV